MAALKVSQLQKLVDTLKLYCLGNQLQEVALTDKHLFLQHYGKGEFTLALELKPLEPQLGYFFGEIPKRKFIVKPIILFLKAHARNLRLVDVEVREELGRVVLLHYGAGERSCVVEFRLIPHGMNVLIKAGDKSISLFPAKELPPSTSSVSIEDEQVFDVDAYLDAWVARLLTPNKNTSGAHQEEQQKKRKKEIEKKISLIEKLEIDLSKQAKPWSDVGEYIKLHQSIDVPQDWLELIDSKLPVNANMQRCFDRHKQQQNRREQILERIQHLKQEIEQLQAALENNESSLDRPVKSLGGELLSKAKARGRKLILSEGVEAVFGKSAKDNMALLRKAQAWDLWLHLRDLPGSHLIIRRPRNKNVDHTLLLTAARWLLSETIGKKKVVSGDRYDVIVTECRHVKPIKGDKLGRVIFQNETNLSLRLS